MLEQLDTNNLNSVDVPLSSKQIKTKLLVWCQAADAEFKPHSGPVLVT